MATLEMRSNEIDTEDCTLTVADYDRTFHLCRSGLWIGQTCRQRQRVVFSYEHDPEPLYVGWAVNGTTVLDPGYGTFTPPWGLPGPGDAQVTYQTGVDWLAHRIALSVAPGTPARTVHLQVLYRTPDGAAAPPSYGPSTVVSLTGLVTTWPAALLEEERRCWRHLLDVIRKYVVVRPWDPPVPWDDLAVLATDPDDRLVLAAADRVAGFDDTDLADAYAARATAVVRRLTLTHAASLDAPTGKAAT